MYKKLNPERGKLRVALSTAIDAELYKACKLAGLKWNQLILMGYRASTKPAASVEVIKLHTEQLENMQKAMEHYRTQYRMLRTQIDTMEEKNNGVALD